LAVARRRRSTAGRVEVYAPGYPPRRPRVGVRLFLSAPLADDAPLRPTRASTSSEGRSWDSSPISRRRNDGEGCGGALECVPYIDYAPLVHCPGVPSQPPDSANLDIQVCSKSIVAVRAVAHSQFAKCGTGRSGYL